MSQLKIREMPREERPREKLAAHGSAALSDPELIAILLRTGIQGANAIEIARRLFEQYRTWNQLSQCARPGSGARSRDWFRQSNPAGGCV